jgi:glycerol-3-phosphate dehydrogenase subunit C
LLDHSNTNNTIYDIRDPLYWDVNSLNDEMNRVYDVCLGCRLCFNLCPSFPSLFDSVDGAGERKREIAENEGRVNKKVERDTYLDLPEGEHASEASIEVEFRGEVTDLTKEERWEVVDLCYQCKLCDPICPYTPGKEHEFQLDFPKLMTRAQAIRTKERGIKINDRFLSNTDLTGKLGALFGPIINLVNKIRLMRFFMDKFIGIHRKRVLPTFQTNTFQKWFKGHESDLKDPIDKVVIFGTCFTNSHDVELGKAAVEILEFNGVECIYPKQQCCGAPYLSPGDFEGFKKQAQPNINEFIKWVNDGYKIVVTGPPTCSLTFKKEYPDYLGLDQDIQKISKNTFDISEYLVYLNKQGKLNTNFKNSIGTINYHVSCHLKAQKMGFKGRDLLRLVPETTVNLVNRCSGMDGGWGMKTEFFDESMKVAERCVNDLGQKEHDSICSDCSLASHQLGQASNNQIASSHPIIELYKAYGFNEK